MSWTKPAWIAAASAVVAAAGFIAWANVSSVTSDTGAAATVGTTITIDGSGFGTKKPNVKLYATDNLHGPVTAKVTAFSDAQVTAVVTKLYPVAAFAGPYDVDVGPPGKDSIHSVLQGGLPVSVGQITTITPTSPAPGATITIDGSLFGPKKGKVIVGGKAAKIVKGKWTNTQIQAVLSKKTPVGSQNVTVTNKLGPAEKAVTVATPSSGGPRVSMTLSKDHFLAAGFTDVHVLPKGTGYEITATSTVHGTAYSFDLDLSNFDLSSFNGPLTTGAPALLEVKEVSPTATTWRASAGQASVTVRTVSGTMRIVMSLANISRVGDGASPDPLPVRSLLIEIQFA